MLGGSNSQRRRTHKRKLDQSTLETIDVPHQPAVPPSSGPEPEDAGLQNMVALYVAILKGATTKPDDRSKLRKALTEISDLAKEEANVEDIVAEGAVQAIVPLLTGLEGAQDTALREDIEKETCMLLGLLATKPEYQNLIAEHEALPGLVSLLHRYAPIKGVQPAAAVARRAADSITNLAHENAAIKDSVREDGGVPPLVALLESLDTKVQRAAAGALRTLAFKNEANKNQIVECNALPTLIQMLRSEETGIHYEAVGVIGNLVHSSQHIKRKVLEEGALQPVISLLSSTCAESQREAALLLGQFATTEPDFKAKIVQRGAVGPLVAMLRSQDAQLKEMAAFALGRLAQNTDNQAGIVQAGGLEPLLALLNEKNGNLQHNAAFALYGLADNEDNIPELIREGGMKVLQECDTQSQQSKDCVNKTVKRLEDKLRAKENKRLLNRILYMMQMTQDKQVRQRIACALARLVHEGDLPVVFVEKEGLTVLLDMLVDRKKDQAAAREAAGALFELCKKAKETSAVEQPPAPATPPVYLGEKYVNSKSLSDVTFLVENRTFYAHRLALSAASDTFRAMFDGNYREKDAEVIPIPDYRYCVFEAMMRCIYTGSIEVTTDMAQELLALADQYMLDNLKLLAQTSIAGELCAENLNGVYDMAENYHASVLQRRCILHALEHFDVCAAAMRPKEFAALLARMAPTLRSSLSEQLRKCGAEEEDTQEVQEAQSQPGAEAW